MNTRRKTWNRPRERTPKEEIEYLKRLLLEEKWENDQLKHRIAGLEMSVTQCPLTGLFNRRMLDKDLDLFVEEAKRHKKSLALLFLDVDDFGALNKRLGHDVGDKILRRVARALTGAIRRSDRAYRYGGEEFVILLPGTNALGARRLAERVRATIGKARRPSVTASLGVAELAEREFALRFLKRADKALREAKKRGKNKVVLA